MAAFDSELRMKLLVAVLFSIVVNWKFCWIFAVPLNSMSFSWFVWLKMIHLSIRLCPQHHQLSNRRDLLKHQPNIFNALLIIWVNCQRKMDWAICGHAPNQNWDDTLQIGYTTSRSVVNFIESCKCWDDPLFIANLVHRLIRKSFVIYRYHLRFGLPTFKCFAEYLQEVAKQNPKLSKEFAHGVPQRCHNQNTAESFGKLFDP